MEKNQYWRYDVTGKVYIAHPDCVLQAVQKILNKQYPDYDHTVLSQAFEVFSDLYAGKYAGYHGCDTWYHDTQHSLDATLALARLLDGYALCRVRTQQRNTWLLENKPQLTARQVVLGLIVALSLFYIALEWTQTSDNDFYEDFASDFKIEDLCQSI